jgi:hypothetical protein
MFRKIWEALALIVLLVLLMHVALASLRPFMPASLTPCTRSSIGGAGK